jgi:hypothetical protein
LRLPWEMLFPSKAREVFQDHFLGCKMMLGSRSVVIAFVQVG